MKRTITIAFVFLATLSAPALASDVRHVPPAEALPAEPLSLSAQVDRAWESTLEIRYRAVGTSAWQAEAFRREADDRYAVTIPAESIMPPGVEYFIVSTLDGAEPAPQFASADSPHRVHVYRDEEEVRREAYLAKYEDRKARAHVAFQYVDFGSRTLDDRSIRDSYYRVDADFSYRLLRFPLSALRFGYTRLEGDVPVTERGDDPDQMCEVLDDCQEEAGFKVGGWFELRFTFVDGVELDARGIVIATTSGFEVGGRGEFRIGVEDSTHVAIGGEYLGEAGSDAFVRLGWGTVPGLPMAATVQVTDLPAKHRAAGVRLLYDIQRPLENGLKVGLRIGYQARDQLIGGVTAGINTTLDF